MMPRVKIAYLVLLGVALFAIPGPIPVGVGLALQLAIGLRVGRLADLARALRKLSPLLFVLALSYAIPWSVQALLTGILAGGRVLALLWASVLVQRTGEPGDLVRGLSGLGLPRLPALAVDLTLSLLAPGERGRGDGSGGGRGRGNAEGAPRLRDVLSGDISVLMRPLERSLERAELRALEVAPDLGPDAAKDLALIAGLATLSQSIRLIKILPGIPFAPGHKSVVLLPLYVVAADRTTTRWGSTALGITNGVVAFAFGDGQFGPFEILKFIAPGIVVDLAWPVLRGRGAFAYGLLGLLAAIARFSAVVAVGWLVQAPAAFFALLAPMGLFHLVFGASSGYVTFHLLQKLGRSDGVGESWRESSEAKESTGPTSKPH